MDKNIYTSSVAEGVTFHAIPEDRFKSSCMEVSFLLPLEKESSLLYNLVMGLLVRTCAAYPTFSSMRRKCAMLYGACVSSSCNNNGIFRELTIDMEMTDDRFIPDGESVAAECAGLLSEVIFRPAPAGEGRLFPQDEIDFVVRSALEVVRSKKDNKDSYAMDRCISGMFEGEPYAINMWGCEDDYKSVTREKLEDAWRTIIGKAEIRIVMVGTADYRSVERIFAKEFAAVERSPFDIPRSAAHKNVAEVRRITERMEMRQSKMVIGMRLPVDFHDERDYAARLMALIYGGYASSLLFEVVREKLSLCYYCSASYYNNNGVMFVTCGLDEENAGVALEEIIRQLGRLASGDFDDDYIEAAKLYSRSALEEVYDSAYSIEQWYVAGLVKGRRSPGEVSEKMNAVTKEQIMECAGLVQVDTVYLLAPEDDAKAEREGVEAV